MFNNIDYAIQAGFTLELVRDPERARFVAKLFLKQPDGSQVLYGYGEATQALRALALADNSFSKDRVVRPVYISAHDAYDMYALASDLAKLSAELQLLCKQLKAELDVGGQEVKVEMITHTRQIWRGSPSRKGQGADFFTALSQMSLGS